ncbi:MAG: SUMF1/EgtB/PvdO family nonheme iron enzyme [Candidatus Omnitrophica bacterium]|nr:SUMF1/EgtB/PvdO family nonheme iron enzyme [Candidatus Omnitrophota bacterium]
MVLIPAGQFLMGSHSGEGVNNEHPQRKVFLSAYYIDKYEVTVAQYRDFCRTTGRNMPTAPSWGWIETHPIVSVSWNDATAYANYYGNRLPTEAEREKAVRAGSKTKYYFGDNEADLNDCAWYSINSGNQTHPIGAKKPNPFGLYDMYGNAWEWCSDWYDPNYYTGGPKNDPPGPASGNLHSVRGGGWGYAADSCRSEVRNGLKPSYWDSCLGFRCAFSP